MEARTRAATPRRAVPGRLRCMPLWQAAKKWLRRLELVEFFFSLPAFAKAVGALILAAVAVLPSLLAWFENKPSWLVAVLIPLGFAVTLLVAWLVLEGYRAFRPNETAGGYPAIPQDDLDLIRECRKIAGEIHDALAGIRIPDPDTPPDQAAAGLMRLDGVSGRLAEYEELHEAITQYKRCVVRLLPDYRSAHLADGERFAAILAPEKTAYRSLLAVSAGLLGIRPPAGPPAPTAP